MVLFAIFFLLFKDSVFWVSIFVCSILQFLMESVINYIHISFCYLHFKSHRSPLVLLFPDLMEMFLIQNSLYILFVFFVLSLFSLRSCIIKKFCRWSEILSIMFPAFRLLVHVFINILSIRGLFLPTILLSSVIHGWEKWEYIIYQ